MKIMKRKPNPVMVAVVGFICLSYLVKHTNGDPFAAGRLVTETAIGVATGTGQKVVDTVATAAKESSEWKFQEEQRLARGSNNASQGVVNVTVVIDGKQLSGAQAQAAVEPQAPVATAPSEPNKTPITVRLN